MTRQAHPRYCLQCDDGALLAHGTKNVSGVIAGEPYTAERVTGWHCPVCGEVEFDAADGQSAARLSAAVRAAHLRVKERNAQAVRVARKKLKLSQAEAGKLFGGGASAFSEYERGKTQPHKSTMLLLRLLDKHPELLPEVAA
jgi:HTH-type transcriptional regulator/antitoxin MqsA